MLTLPHGIGHWPLLSKKGSSAILIGVPSTPQLMTSTNLERPSTTESPLLPG